MDGISLKKLSDGIIAACREKAKSLPRFSDGDGAIRITFLPQSALGRQLQAASSELAARYEVATKFSDDGNFVTGRTTEEPVDTYSRTAMKIASYLRKQEGKQIDHSAERGFGPTDGVLSFQLLFDHAIFGVLLVCVDGGVQGENEYVVEAARSAVCDWCRTGPLTEDSKTRLFYIAN